MQFFRCTLLTSPVILLFFILLLNIPNAFSQKNEKNEKNNSEVNETVVKAPSTVRNEIKPISFNNFRGKENAYDLLVERVDATGIADDFGLDEIPVNQLSWKSDKSDRQMNQALFLVAWGAGLLLWGSSEEGQDGYPQTIFGSIVSLVGIGKTIHEARKPHPSYVLARMNKDGQPTLTIPINDVKKSEAKKITNAFNSYFIRKIKEENSRIIFDLNYKANFDMYIYEIKQTDDYNGSLACIQGDDASNLLDALKITRSTKNEDDRQSSFEAPLFYDRPISLMNMDDAMTRYPYLENKLPHNLADLGGGVSFSFTKKDEEEKEADDAKYKISEVRNIPGMLCMTISEKTGSTNREACYFFTDPGNPFQFRDLYLLLEDIKPEISKGKSGKIERTKKVGPVFVTEMIDTEGEQEIITGYSLHPIKGDSNCCPDADKEE